MPMELPKPLEHRKLQQTSILRDKIAPPCTQLDCMFVRD